MLPLSNYNVPNKYLIKALQEQDVMSKSLTASVMLLKIKLKSSENEKRLVEKNNVELMRKYGEHDTMVRRKFW